jgi:hypothetical protein
LSLSDWGELFRTVFENPWSLGHVVEWSSGSVSSHLQNHDHIVCANFALGLVHDCH